MSGIGVFTYLVGTLVISIALRLWSTPDSLNAGV